MYVSYYCLPTALFFFPAICSSLHSFPRRVFLFCFLLFEEGIVLRWHDSVRNFYDENKTERSIKLDLDAIPSFFGFAPKSHKVCNKLPHRTDFKHLSFLRSPLVRRNSHTLLVSPFSLRRRERTGKSDRIGKYDEVEDIWHVLQLEKHTARLITFKAEQPLHFV